MMANEIGEWLWISADVVLLSALAAVLLGRIALPTLRSHTPALRFKTLIPAIRSLMFGRTQHPQKTV